VYSSTKPFVTTGMSFPSKLVLKNNTKSKCLTNTRKEENYILITSK
jgi:hypothetical protein